MYLYDEKRDVSVPSRNLIAVEPVKLDKVCGTSFSFGKYKFKLEVKCFAIFLFHCGTIRTVH